MKKNFKLLVVLILMMVLLVACSGPAATEAVEPPVATQKPQEDTSAKQIKVALILTETGLGDLGFNDLAYQGIQEAQAEFGIEYDVIEPKQISDEEQLQGELAASGEYELIICVGFEQRDALAVNAAAYPNQKFTLIDSVVDSKNVANYASKEHEGSFLVGALAALAQEGQVSDLINQNKIIGFVGGIESPLIQRFLAGYSAGARYIDPEFQILFDYVGGFADTGTAKAISDTMFSKGASIIYHAAGGSGLGVFTSAEDNKFAAIGCNTNQNALNPDYIMASMLKLVNRAVLDSVQNVVNGTFEGGQFALGLEDGAVGYSVEGSNIMIPADIIAKVEKIKQDIIDGKIIVPSTLEEIEPFVESNTFSD